MSFTRIFLPVLLLVTMAVEAAGVALKEGDFFSFEQLPSELRAVMSAGGKIEFSLEENATTGYIWSAKYDHRNCRVWLRHEGSEKQIPGAPGRVRVVVEPLIAGVSEIEFNYARPFETGVVPAKQLRCVIEVVADDGSGKTPGKLEVSAGIKELKPGSFYRLKELPDGVLLRAGVGERVKFRLEEDSGRSEWSVAGLESGGFCVVSVSHERGFWPWSSAYVEITVEGTGNGGGWLDLRYGSRDGGRRLRVFVEDGGAFGRESD